MSNVERFVPIGPYSLSSDAPGWSSSRNHICAASADSKSSNSAHNRNNVDNKSIIESDNDDDRHLLKRVDLSIKVENKKDVLTDGPVCWKCKGKGQIICKKKGSKINNRRKKMKIQCTKDNQKNENITLENDQEKDCYEPQTILDNDKNTNLTISLAKVSLSSCTVCNGTGFLMPKQREIQSSNEPGMITFTRNCPPDWEPMGPVAYSITQMKLQLSKPTITTTSFTKDGTKAIVKDNEENYEKLTMLDRQYRLLQKATKRSNKKGVLIDEDPIIHKKIKQSHDSGKNNDSLGTSETGSFLPWFPSNPGEQLCNLVGTWRILQRVGSHRWTTDDLVTAFVAMSETKHRKLAFPKSSLNYLDLGCGNGSVLQMVCWALKSQFNICAFGMEARSEAVSLARRSLSFNVGSNHDDDNQMSIIHCDFRDLIHYNSGNNDSSSSTLQNSEKIAKVHAKKFDLITGTPPYFQVDFTTTKASTSKVTTKTQNIASDEPNKDDTSIATNDNGNRIVSSAVINQGGMPTSIQSAPARCEFRGGVEAYCAAASKVLADDGIFVVCENWLNNKRVYEGAEQSGLQIFKVIPVKGKTTRKENLFGVYLMQRKKIIKKRLNSTNSTSNDKEDSMSVLPALSVRDENGKWTKAYALVLEQMSIPARHEMSEAE